MGVYANCELYNSYIRRPWLLRALRPTNLTYLEHATHATAIKRTQITTANSKTTMDFGNLFTDWESELCDNSTERDTILWRHNLILAPLKYHIHLVGACA